ncbi:MAG: ABC transporter permease, partial [Acidimicrobiales bacterium]
FDVLFSRQTIEPLLLSLRLGLSVSIGAAAVGTVLAWLTIRTDLPGRKLWQVLCPLPLVLPSFVAAAAIISAFGPGGMLESILEPLGVENLPSMRTFWGAWVVLTLITYPYVYLPVAARLAGLPPSLEESARMLGRTSLASFREVIWPQTVGAVRAGALLAFLYTISDFGAVTLLGQRVLTTRIYASRLADRPLSLALSLVLGIAAIAIVMLERRTAPEELRTAAASTARGGHTSLGRWRWAASLIPAFVLFVSVIGPLAVLVWWAEKGLSSGAAGFTSVGGGLGSLWIPTWNSVRVSILAAIVATLLIFPIAWLTVRYKSRLAGSLNGVVLMGFALPGLVIALAMVFMALNVPLLSSLYQTITLLILAYVVHFGGQSLRTAQVAVVSLSPQLEEAAQTLGARRIRRLLRIELPILAPGLAAGAGLVLLSTMKELPASLLVSPAGFETLSVRIWDATNEGFLTEAAIGSLLLVAVSGLLTWILILRQIDRFD